jgi:CheY-like chemotaxis protein
MLAPLKILVAEDELGDVLLLKRAFVKAGVRMPVHFARNGQEVLDYLEGKTPFDDPVAYPLPDLLLLDLKLPGIDGFEVLTWLRAQPGLSPMCVVVLTTSDYPVDVNRAYALGANAYLVKPQDPADLIRVVERIDQFWHSIPATANPSPASRISVAL